MLQRSLFFSRYPHTSFWLFHPTRSCRIHPTQRTQKIVYGAAAIAAANGGELKLGNFEISRDWGWAPEYVEVMWRMLQQQTPDDFVIATGRTVSLEYFVIRVFQNFDLDWRKHVSVDDALRRPSDIHIGAANPGKAASALGWKAHFDVDQVIDSMCAASRDAVRDQTRE